MPSIGKICEFATVLAHWAVFGSMYLTFEGVFYVIIGRKNSKLETLHILASVLKSYLTQKGMKWSILALKYTFLEQNRLKICN